MKSSLAATVCTKALQSAASAIHNKRILSTFMVFILLLEPVLGLTVSLTSNGIGSSITYKSVDIEDSINTQIILTPNALTHSTHSTSGDLNETHWSKEGRARVSTVLRRARDYTYDWSNEPIGNNVSEMVSQNLDVNYADYIKTDSESTSANGSIKASVGTVVEHGGLLGYQSAAWIDNKGNPWAVQRIGRSTGDTIHVSASPHVHLNVTKGLISGFSSADVGSLAVQSGHVVTKGGFKSVVDTSERISNFHDTYDIFGVYSKDVKINRLTYYTDPSKRIQAAVDASQSGDVIKAAPGVYKENVRINHTLKLLGGTSVRNNNSVIIDGQYEGNYSQQNYNESRNNFSKKPTIYVDEKAAVLLDGITAIHGTTGLYNKGRTFLRNCTFKSNDLGIYNDHLLYMNNTKIQGNRAGLYQFDDLGTSVVIIGASNISNNRQYDIYSRYLLKPNIYDGCNATKRSRVISQGMPPSLKVFFYIPKIVSTTTVVGLTAWMIWDLFSFRSTPILMKRGPKPPVNVITDTLVAENNNIVAKFHGNNVLMDHIEEMGVFESCSSQINELHLENAALNEHLTRNFRILDLYENNAELASDLRATRSYIDVSQASRGKSGADIFKETEDLITKLKTNEGFLQTAGVTDFEETKTVLRNSINELSSGIDSSDMRTDVFKTDKELLQKYNGDHSIVTAIKEHRSLIKKINRNQDLLDAVDEYYTSNIEFEKNEAEIEKLEKGRGVSWAKIDLLKEKRDPRLQPVLRSRNDLFKKGMIMPVAASSIDKLGKKDIKNMTKRSTHRLVKEQGSWISRPKSESALIKEGNTDLYPDESKLLWSWAKKRGLSTTVDDIFDGVYTFLEIADETNKGTSTYYPTLARWLFVDPLKDAYDLTSLIWDDTIDNNAAFGKAYEDLEMGVTLSDVIRPEDTQIIYSGA
jgi:hypothetical protein